MTLGRLPPPSAYVPLDAEHVRTRYLARKGERLAAGDRVTYLAGWGSAVTFPFRVDSDHGAYLVHVQPFRQDGAGHLDAVLWAHCGKGGDHDLSPPRAACSHMVAAAAELLASVVPALLGRPGVDCPHPVVEDEACVVCGEVLQEARS